MFLKHPCCCFRRSKIGYCDSSEEEVHNLAEVVPSPPTKTLSIPINETKFSLGDRMDKLNLKADPNEYEILGLICRCYDGSASIHVARHKPTGRYLSIKKVELDMLDREDSGLSSLHDNLLKDLLSFCLFRTLLRCQQFVLAAIFVSTRGTIAFLQLAVKKPLRKYEFNLMRQMQHEHILPYYCAFVNNHELWVVLPLMEQGSARDLLDKHCPDGLGETAIAHVIRDILLAAAYIHDMGYVHRSIKASHIFLSRSGRVYLSGFRTAVSMVDNGKKLRALHDFTSDMVQNLHWLAPEVLEQNLLGYDEKSDIYSIGITACELANGCIPFSDMPAMKMLLEKMKSTTPKLLDRITLKETEDFEITEINQNEEPIEHSEILLSSDPNPYTRQFSSQFHNFIEVCLQQDPNDRPSASKLLSHAFFEQVKEPSTKVLAALFQKIKPVSYTPSRPGSEDVSEAIKQLGHLAVEEPWSFD